MNKELTKQLIPIFMASSIAWFYTMVYAPLGYMYNSFPGMDSKVMLIAVLPGIVAMVGGFAAGALMNVIGKKPLVLLSMLMMVIGGLMVRFIGEANINLVIIGSGLTGFGAGAIPSVNMSVLALIAPDNLKDKVCGWADAVCLAGMFVVAMAAGFLAADGDWTKAFDVYWAVIVVLVIALILYPNDKDLKANASAEAAVTETEEESVLPKSVVVLASMKFVCALFYMGIGLFVSDYVINEVQIGSSASIGTMQSLSSLLGMFASMFVFVFLKFLKGWEGTIMMIICGIGVYLAGVSATIPLVAAGWFLQAAGCNAYHSGNSTLCAMAPKGKAVGIASGLLLGAGFLGEALAGYALPAISNMVFGNTMASNCMKIGGIGCVICAIIVLPFFRSAYKVVFGEKKEEKVLSELAEG